MHSFKIMIISCYEFTRKSDCSRSDIVKDKGREIIAAHERFLVLADMKIPLLTRHPDIRSMTEPGFSEINQLIGC
jgi:hypothetical protein